MSKFNPLDMIFTQKIDVVQELMEHAINNKGKKVEHLPNRRGTLVKSENDETLKKVIFQGRERDLIKNDFIAKEKATYFDNMDFLTAMSRPMTHSELGFNQEKLEELDYGKKEKLSKEFKVNFSNDTQSIYGTADNEFSKYEHYHIRKEMTLDELGMLYQTAYLKPFIEIYEEYMSCTTHNQIYSIYEKKLNEYKEAIRENIEIIQENAKKIHKNIDFPLYNLPLVHANTVTNPEVATDTLEVIKRNLEEINKEIILQSEEWFKKAENLSQILKHSDDNLGRLILNNTFENKERILEFLRESKEVRKKKISDEYDTKIEALKNRGNLDEKTYKRNSSGETEIYDENDIKENEDYGIKEGSAYEKLIEDRNYFLNKIENEDEKSIFRFNFDKYQNAMQWFLEQQENVKLMNYRTNTINDNFLTSALFELPNRLKQEYMKERTMAEFFMDNKEFTEEVTAKVLKEIDNFNKEFSKSQTDYYREKLRSVYIGESNIFKDIEAPKEDYGFLKLIVENLKKQGKEANLQRNDILLLNELINSHINEDIKETRENFYGVISCLETADKEKIKRTVKDLVEANAFGFDMLTKHNNLQTSTDIRIALLTEYVMQTTYIDGLLKDFTNSDLAKIAPFDLNNENSIDEYKTEADYMRFIEQLGKLDETDKEKAPFNKEKIVRFNETLRNTIQEREKQYALYNTLDFGNNRIKSIRENGYKLKMELAEFLNEKGFSKEFKINPSRINFEVKNDEILTTIKTPRHQVTLTTKMKEISEKLKDDDFTDDKKILFNMHKIKQEFAKVLNTEYKEEDILKTYANSINMFNLIQREELKKIGADFYKEAITLKERNLSQQKEFQNVKYALEKTFEERKKDREKLLGIIQEVESNVQSIEITNDNEYREATQGIIDRRIVANEIPDKITDIARTQYNSLIAFLNSSEEKEIAKLSDDLRIFAQTLNPVTINEIFNNENKETENLVPFLKKYYNFKYTQEIAKYIAIEEGLSEERINENHTNLGIDEFSRKISLMLDKNLDYNSDNFKLINDIGNVNGKVRDYIIQRIDEMIEKRQLIPKINLSLNNDNAENKEAQEYIKNKLTKEQEIITRQEIEFEEKMKEMSNEKGAEIKK